MVQKSSDIVWGLGIINNITNELTQSGRKTQSEN